MAKTISVADGSRESDPHFKRPRYRHPRRSTGTRPEVRGREAIGEGSPSARGLISSTAARAAALSVYHVASMADVLRPFRRQGLLWEDRVDRAFGLAGASIDALVRVDEELSIRASVEVDAVDRTDGHARRGRARRCKARRSHTPFRALLEGQRCRGASALRQAGTSSGLTSRHKGASNPGDRDEYTLRTQVPGVDSRPAMATAPPTGPSGPRPRARLSARRCAVRPRPVGR